MLQPCKKCGGLNFPIYTHQPFFSLCTMLTSTGSLPRAICSPEESLQTRVNSPLWPSRPCSTPVSYSRTDTCEWHRPCSGSSDRSFLLTCDMLHPSETGYRKINNIGRGLGWCYSSVVDWMEAYLNVSLKLIVIKGWLMQTKWVEMSSIHHQREVCCFTGRTHSESWHLYCKGVNRSNEIQSSNLNRIVFCSH